MTNLQTLSVLIYGDSKTGKSTLAATAPTPIVVADVEGGWKFIDRKVVYWNPQTEKPPVPDDSWDVCVVVTREWNTFSKLFDWLASGQHGFRTIVIDSITELQRRCRENISSDAFRIQDWGLLLSAMDKAIRGFRDLTLVPGSPIEVAVFVAESRMKDGKWRPFLQGQIEVSLPYWMDCVGFLFAQPSAHPDGAVGPIVRQLLISPHPTYVTGERLQGRLDPVITDPNLTQMYKAVYPTASTTKTTTPAKTAKD